MKLRRRFPAWRLIVFAACLTLSGPLSGQELSVGTRVLLPVADSQRWFQSGLGAGVSLAWPLPDSPFAVKGSLEVVTLFDKAQRPVLLSLLAPGAWYRLGWGDGWSLLVNADAGLGVASKGNFDLITPAAYLAAGVGVEKVLAPTLSVRGGIQYSVVLGLLQGLSFWTTFSVGEAP